MSLWRIKIVIIFFFLFSLIIGARLFYWQIIKGEKLSAQAEFQYQSQQEIPSTRGLIYTTDGFPIVSNQEVFNVFMEKQKEFSLDNDKLNCLAQILASEEVKNKLEKQDQTWVYLAKAISKDQKEQIENLQIKGIGFEQTERRDYPEGSMSAQLLGFLGKDNLGRNQGYFGLEGFYDRQLRGKTGVMNSEKDALGKPIPIANKMENQMVPGRDLMLFLDRGLQFMVEEKLKLALQKYGAKAGSVLIMDPQTGGIVASASFPNYDPSNYSLEDKTLFPDPVISQTFEPGSIFKVLVMASAINENIVKPDDQCQICFGPKVIGEYAIRTWNDQYHPNSTMTEILQHSDNVGMVYVAEKLGKQKLYQNLNNFGVGKLTGIDLEGEMSVPLRPWEKWADIDLATISFGQGVAVTPLEMVTAVGAIANGGKLLEPHVVKKISSLGQEIMINPKIIRNPVSETTARIITEMMIKATMEGEAKWALPKGYRIAGKTGTAQIPIAGHYDTQKTMASFIGFAPSDKPRFVMLVLLREPASSPWGSETAAPLWFDIAKEIFKIWGIPPD